MGKRMRSVGYLIEKRKCRGKREGSFVRRLIKVWIFGVAIPLVLVELLFLVQFYRINYQQVEE